MPDSTSSMSTFIVGVFHRPLEAPGLWRSIFLCSLGADTRCCQTSSSRIASKGREMRSPGFSADQGGGEHV